MIINLYIEIKDLTDQTILENYLHKQGYTFYDCTYNDPRCNNGFTLDEIEADIEGK